MEGDVPAPIPRSPKPGPSTEPEERDNQAATGKMEYYFKKKYLWGCFGRHAMAFFVTVISIAWQLRLRLKLLNSTYPYSSTETVNAFHAITRLSCSRIENERYKRIFQTDNVASWNTLRSYGPEYWGFKKGIMGSYLELKSGLASITKSMRYLLFSEQHRWFQHAGIFRQVENGRKRAVLRISTKSTKTESGWKLCKRESDLIWTNSILCVC